MPLTIVGDKDSDFPEALRAKLRQENGKYVIAEGTDGFKFENTDGLRSAVSVEREKRGILERKIKMYGWHVDDEGRLRESAEGVIHPDAARDALDKVKNGAITTKEPKEIEELRRELQRDYKEKFERDKLALDQERDTWARERHDILVKDRGTAAIKAVGGSDDTVAALMHVLKENVKVEAGADGRSKVVIYENGKQLISRRNGSAEPMGLDEYAATLRDNRLYKPLFPLKSPGGSGADHTGGGSATGGGTNNNGLFGERRLQAVLERTA